MDFVEKALKIKENEAFKVEGWDSVYQYVKEHRGGEEYNTIKSIHAPYAEIDGWKFLELLENPERIQKVIQKQKLPSFVFDWIDLWVYTYGKNNKIKTIKVSNSLISIKSSDNWNYEKIFKLSIMEEGLKPRELETVEDFFNAYEREE